MSSTLAAVTVKRRSIAQRRSIPAPCQRPVVPDTVEGRMRHVCNLPQMPGPGRLLQTCHPEVPAVRAAIWLG